MRYTDAEPGIRTQGKPLVVVLNKSDMKTLDQCTAAEKALVKAMEGPGVQVHPQSQTRNQEPEILSPKPEISNQKPETRSPLCIRNPQPSAIYQVAQPPPSSSRTAP